VGLLDELISALPEDLVITDPDLLAGYQRDEADLCAYGLPVAVVRPRETAQVAAVVKLAARHGVPVVAQGARTGLAGAANALDGSIVVSFTGMDRIMEIDPVNRIAVVQPGVVNANRIGPSPTTACGTHLIPARGSRPPSAATRPPTPAACAA
jgi:glycolate dehydrogenase FAD-linked subunit